MLGIVRTTLAWAIEKYGDPINANILRNARPRSAKEYLDLITERSRFVEMWNKEVWGMGGYDAIVCPVLATPCFTHTYVFAFTTCG